MKYVYLFLLLIITLPAMANNKVSGEDIVQKATQYSGIRYTPGGSNPKRGFDCSGFVSYVFRKLDISVPRSSASLFCKDKQVSDYKDLHLGDLVFFKGSNSRRARVGHVGLVTEVYPDGRFKFIHASTSQGIREDWSSSPYYAKRYMGARRIYLAQIDLYGFIIAAHLVVYVNRA